MSKNSKPLTSIIIPFYNAEKYIEEAIKSAYNQSYENIEVICVDNNSTDNSLSIVKNLKKLKHPSISILEETKSGAPAARNRGLANARGKYIQFLDADDILLSHKIIEHVRLLEENKSAKFFISGSGLTENTLGERKEFIAGKKSSDYFLGLTTVGLGTTSTNLFLTESIKLIGGWNSSLKSSQEYYLMFELLKNGYIPIFDCKPSVILRQVPGSISRSDDDAHMERYYKFTCKVYEYLLNSGKELPQIYFLHWFWDLRRLYRLNKIEALRIYKQYFHDFTPESYGYTSKTYCSLYKIVGFAITEKIYSLLE